MRFQTTLEIFNNNRPENPLHTRKIVSKFKHPLKSKIVIGKIKTMDARTFKGLVADALESAKKGDFFDRQAIRRNLGSNEVHNALGDLEKHINSLDAHALKSIHSPVY